MYFIWSSRWSSQSGFGAGFEDHFKFVNLVDACLQVSLKATTVTLTSSFKKIKFDCLLFKMDFN